MSHNPQHQGIPGREYICAFLPAPRQANPQKPENASSQMQRQQGGTKSLSRVSRHFLPKQKEEPCVQHTCGQRLGLLQRVAACPSQRDMASRVRLTALVNRFSSQPAHRYAAHTTQHVSCSTTQHFRFNATTAIGNAAIRSGPRDQNASPTPLPRFLAPSHPNACYGVLSRVTSDPIQPPRRMLSRQPLTPRFDATCVSFKLAALVLSLMRSLIHSSMPDAHTFHRHRHIP